LEGVFCFVGCGLIIVPSCTPRVVNRSHAELFTALEFSIRQHPIGRKLIDILC